MSLKSAFPKAFFTSLSISSSRTFTAASFALIITCKSFTMRFTPVTLRAFSAWRVPRRMNRYTPVDRDQQSLRPILIFSFNCFTLR
jgi:hypothetical protein